MSGTKTLGNTSGATATSATAGQASFWRGNNALHAPEEMWVVDLWYWMGASGASRTIQGACYFTNNNQAGGAAGTNTMGTTVQFQGSGYALNSGNNNQGGNSPYLHFNTGDYFTPAMWSNGAATLGGDGGSGHYAELNAGSLPSTLNGMTQDAFGQIGDPHYYVTYFPKVTISSLTSTPVGVGQSFTINGRSYNAGINSITVNGVAVTTFTVNSDSQITATVPAGATTGPVFIDSKAGTVTSSQNLTIVGMHVFDGTVWQPASVFVFDGSVWQPASSVSVWDGSVWQPGT